MKSERLFEGIGYVDDAWIAMLDQPLVRNEGVQASENKHFVLYEIRKLLGIRYLWIFLSVFLFINSAAAYVTAGQSRAAGEPANEISAFFALYRDDPAPLDAYYETLSNFNAEQQKLMIEAMRRGEEYIPETLPNVYSKDDMYADTDLFRTLYHAVEHAESYPATIDGVISRAYANLDEFRTMGLPTECFSYRYQETVIDLYEIARDNVALDVSYTRGWDEYFAYDTQNVFLFLMLILLGSVLFTSEKQSGFLPILRSAKNGRGRTAVAKGWTALLLAGIFCLLFTMSTFAVIGFRLGYSDPTNAIQSLSAFALSPYLLTIGEYFLITLALRFVSCAVFVLLVVVLSVLLGNYTLVYLAGLGVFGLNLLFYLLPLRDTFAAAKHLNLLALADGDPLFVRYRAVNLFGNVAGYVPFGVPLYVLLGIGLFAAICVLFVKYGTTVRHVGWIDTAVSFVLTKAADVKSRLTHLPAAVFVGHAKVHRRRVYSLSLFCAECFKTLISSRFIFVLILLLCVKIGYSAEIYGPNNSFYDQVYKEYMTTLAGPLTDEKLEYLRAERTQIDTTMARQTEMQCAYAEQRISFDEYRAYMSDYQYACSRAEILEAVEAQARYLETTVAQENPGWFIYDTGWEKLFSSDADLFLYAAILLLLTGTFASEYTAKSSAGSFAQLLRSTKHGRETTFYAKLISAETITFVLAVTMGAIDLVRILSTYDTPDAGAPLISLQMFAGIGTSIPLGMFAILFSVMRLAGALLLSLLVCALSELLCKYLPILGSTVALTMLPALCAAFGLAAAEKISFLNLLAGTPLFLQSMRSGFLGGWGMLALWLSLWCAVIAAVLVPAKKVFVR